MGAGKKICRGGGGKPKMATIKTKKPPYIEKKNSKKIPHMAKRIPPSLHKEKT